MKRMALPILVMAVSYTCKYFTKLATGVDAIKLFQAVIQTQVLQDSTFGIGSHSYPSPWSLKDSMSLALYKAWLEITGSDNTVDYNTAVQIKPVKKFTIQAPGFVFTTLYLFVTYKWTQ